MGSDDPTITGTCYDRWQYHLCSLHLYVVSMVWLTLEMCHQQVDFFLSEPSLIVEHVNTVLKLTHCDRHVTGMLKSKLPLLGAASNYSNRALYTDPACGIKCLVKVWLRKMKRSFPCKSKHSGILCCSDSFRKIPSASCCSSQLHGSLGLTTSFPLVYRYHSLPATWQMRFLAPPSSWCCRLRAHFLGWTWVCS